MRTSGLRMVPDNTHQVTWQGSRIQRNCVVVSGALFKSEGCDGLRTSSRTHLLHDIAGRDRLEVLYIR